MTGDTPPPHVAYAGPITDTDRWLPFRHRDDDIFICTPPKCGTTWMQAICAMLLFGTAAHGRKPNELSLWLDAKFEPLDVYLEKVEAQTQRRFFKTHTPLDGIPDIPGCTYLVVLRDPRDVFPSVMGHAANMNFREVVDSCFPDADNAFEGWLERAWSTDSWDVQSLAAVVHFFETYWAARDRPNVHLFHYSDLVRDLRGSIASIAAALEISVTADQLDEFVAGASFDAMKREADRFVPFANVDGFWKSTSGFFAGGGIGRWREVLSSAEADAFDRRLAELLPPDQAAWLVNGSGPT